VTTTTTTNRGGGGADMFDALWQWCEANSALLGWLFALSLGSLVLTIVLLPVVVVRLPADHFVADRRQRLARRGVAGWCGLVLKNLLGAVFALAGVAMLLLPGQGLLTILIGLLLLDFPGKRALELRLLRRPGLRAFLDRMRQRRGVAPFVLERP
jgi:hypothetical protein